jgi:hypothetical protein
VLLGILLQGIIAMLGSITLFRTPAEAQTGKNAVFDSLGNCSPCQKSPAFIDASVFGGSGTTVCSVLNQILATVVPPTYPQGAVIDARGLPAAGTSMSCNSTVPTPWFGISNPPPSTILLPATTPAAPIKIPSTWILPPNTHLIGEGDNIASSTAISTTIQAKSSVSGSMIQFGSGSCLPPGGSPSTCNGISVENLALDGLGSAITGISNSFGTDQSYVDHVTLYQILGTGLLVSAYASNSGPYSNITFDTGNTTSATSTVCAQIVDAGSTRGISGLSCTSESNTPQAAILLDSSNNSLSDIRIAGFYDGIRVGANGNAQSNVLSNVVGDTNVTSGLTPIIVVHITNSSYTVSDLSIMGISNAGGTGTVTMEDDLTGAQIADPSVGIYALGNKGEGLYYSRFTTSPNLASWVVGPNYPQGSCAQGSLYSCIGNNLNGTNCSNTLSPPYFALWGCAYTNTHALVWQGIL